MVSGSETCAIMGKMNSKKRSLQFAIRGANIGAVVLGVTGFASGMAACIHYELPIPPIFTFEMGLLLGGGLGALLGYLCSFPRGLRTLQGLVFGFLVGLLVGAMAGAVLATVVVFVCLGALMGAHGALPEEETGGWELASS